MSNENSEFYVNFRFIQNLEFGRGISSHIMTAIATGIECRRVSVTPDAKAPPRGTARYYSNVYKANKWLQSQMNTTK